MHLKAPKTAPLVLTIRLVVEKSSPLCTLELISDPASELAATEAGRLVIQASIRGKAEVQCGLPRWIALVLASPKAFLNLFQVFTGFIGQTSHTQGLEVSKRHFPAPYTEHTTHGCQKTAWVAGNKHIHLA